MFSFDHSIIILVLFARSHMLLFKLCYEFSVTEPMRCFYVPLLIIQIIYDPDFFRVYPQFCWLFLYYFIFLFFIIFSLFTGFLLHWGSSINWFTKEFAWICLAYYRLINSWCCFCHFICLRLESTDWRAFTLIFQLIEFFLFSNFELLCLEFFWIDSCLNIRLFKRLNLWQF